MALKGEIMNDVQNRRIFYFASLTLNLEFLSMEMNAIRGANGNQHCATVAQVLRAQMWERALRMCDRKVVQA